MIVSKKASTAAINMNMEIVEIKIYFLVNPFCISILKSSVKPITPSMPIYIILLFSSALILIFSLFPRHSFRVIKTAATMESICLLYTSPSPRDRG